MTPELMEDMKYAAEISILALSLRAMENPKAAKDCERKISHIKNEMNKFFCNQAGAMQINGKGK